MALPKVVILAGGRGTRLGELTNEIPKPLVSVGGIPLIQHIMNHYMAHGFTEFVLPIGYLGHKIREYFTTTSFKLYWNSYDSKMNMISKFTTDRHSLILVETGMDTQTGGRLRRLESMLTEPFCMTYGDGISNIDVSQVVEVGQKLSKNVVSSVHPTPRFGSMTIAPDGTVMAFTEKQTNPNEWINAGFMYLKPNIFQYITDDDTNFEKYTIPRLVWDGDVVAFKHEGYWQCCDTMRDLYQLREDYENGVF